MLNLHLSDRCFVKLVLRGRSGVVSALTGENLPLEVYEGWQLDGVYQSLLRGSPVDGTLTLCSHKDADKINSDNPK